MLQLIRRCQGWAQPWRCLWRGSSQMTMTRPCRRMTRHLLQIFLTLGLTFTVCLTSHLPARKREPAEDGHGLTGRVSDYL